MHFEKVLFYFLFRFYAWHRLVRCVGGIYAGQAHCVTVWKFHSREMGQEQFCWVVKMKICETEGLLWKKYETVLRIQFQPNQSTFTAYREHQTSLYAFLSFDWEALEFLRINNSIVVVQNMHDKEPICWWDDLVRCGGCPLMDMFCSLYYSEMSDPHPLDIYRGE